MSHIVRHNTTDPSSTDLVNLQQVRRIKQIHDACANTSVFADQIYHKRSQVKYLYSLKYNLNYCKVPKIGSSFWTQTFSILNRGSSVAMFVFGLPRGQVHRKLTRQSRIKFDSNERRMSRSVLTARDPYSRLYSAYVDKVLLQRFGSGKLKRNNLHSACGSEITFQEFLSAILKTTFEGKPLNRHWAPIISLCNPCSVTPFALVKQETFSTDVEFVLHEIGVTADELKVLHDALHGNRIQTTVTGIVYTALKSKPKSEACTPTTLDVAESIWQSFQIQGYIRSDFPLPVEFIPSVEDIRPKFLTDLILKTINENPLTVEESKQQRRQYLVDAYNEIDKKIIEDIQRVYRQDFILFDYPLDPPV